MCVRVCACKCASARVYVCVRVRACMYVCMYVSVCVCMCVTSLIEVEFRHSEFDVGARLLQLLRVTHVES